MITRKNTFFIGIFVFLVPFLGIPTSSKTFFIVVSGLVLIFLSIKINLPKKPTKPVRVKKEKVVTVLAENPTFNSKELKVEEPNSNTKSIDGIQTK